MSYLFVDDPQARLKAVEEFLDEGTIRIFERLGVGTDWKCLEVGAGAGSIALWLAQRTQVVATDIDTRHLDVHHANMEVLEHNIVADPLEESTFDLVHARLLLEHLRERELVLDKLTRALRPGGWLVVESVDYVSGVAIGDFGAEEHERVLSARLRLFRESGLDPDLGRQLPSHLRARGLVNLGNEGRVWVMEAGSAPARWFQLSLAHLRPRLVGSGKVSDAAVGRSLDVMEDPRWSAYSPIVLAAWGQRPRRPAPGL